ncbi:katanin p80 WD40 repeat-containing subunit B1 [Bradysia coprophila]|uniref:katanin p80 WD40 repeat-containing subunit B1 n=1 Tax=Bradysia coprophila TaxID=38358 RepID=UPI00187D7CEF|nr:katanin p80 WD40 repeat-containing subunit B1 [Bradysia coprophila]
MALPRKLASKIYEIEAHAQKVRCLDLGETGRVLVTGGQDRNVNLWAFGNDKRFMSLSEHNGAIDCVKFAYNDNYVYSADEHGIIKRWDLNGQTGSSTFFGHMKSVRTLDFHPYGEYVVSGSNDTTVRLWDVRKDNQCIYKYRGHIANINSVKFSPDGSWIASAGTEGSVIIWDIRTQQRIIEFQEHASPVTCIQFHPFEFLLAAGRNDGSVDLYDLESRKLVSRSDTKNSFSSSTVKCITFSENGQCLFVGTADGISVIGWEPDRQFDNIESAWSMLGDIQVFKNKLFCGSYENQKVEIHAINLDDIIPFYNPLNKPFNPQQSSRKSFSRGNSKHRVSIGKTVRSTQDTINENSSEPPSLDDLSANSIYQTPPSPLPHGFSFGEYASTRESYLFDSLPNDNYKYNEFDNPTSTPTSAEPDMFIDNYDMSDLDYYPMRSSPGSSNVVEPEREDFPVNSAQPPDYAPKMDITSLTKQSSKFRQPMSRRNSPPNHPIRTTVQRKLSGVSSISTTDLHRIDEPSSMRPMGRAMSPVRNFMARQKKNINNNNHKNEINSRESSHLSRNSKLTVQIHTPPMKQAPARSKTAFDLRSSLPVSPLTQRTSNFHGHSMTDESSEFHLLNTGHDRVYQELQNRYVALESIRKSMRNQDINIMGALKQSIKTNDRSVLVDLLGAVIEKAGTWNLDMCLILLPEIYEMLQSADSKFHTTRACDTLRVILLHFLPVIQANIDSYAPTRALGVDIPREERQNKCLECRDWLLRIKSLPENRHIGSSLLALQNLIVDI